jgi:hypothetical protein
MTQQGFTLPTEIVKLPSKGLVYPKENPLSSGEIEMKYMTAKEEDILTNQNYIAQGIVFDKLFQSMIVSKINYDDLIAGDKNAILLAARILGYGKDYEVVIKHPVTGEEEKQIIDLTQLKEKEIDFSLFNNKNEVSFVLPKSGNEITLKLLTHADEKIIDTEIKALKKIKQSAEVTLRLKQQILSVNGITDKKTIRDFVDNGLLAADTMELRKFIKTITPDIDMTFTFVGSDGYTEEGVSLPIGLSFFYPQLSI